MHATKPLPLRQILWLWFWALIILGLYRIEAHTRLLNAFNWLFDAI